MVAFLAMSLATSSAVMPFYQGGEGLSEGGLINAHTRIALVPPFALPCWRRP